MNCSKKNFDISIGVYRFLLKNGSFTWFNMQESLQYGRVHDMHGEPKSYKLKLLRKLVTQHGIKAFFGGMSCVPTSPSHV